MRKSGQNWRLVEEAAELAERKNSREQPLGNGQQLKCLWGGDKDSVRGKNQGASEKGGSFC